jgi:hypothetical protein
MAKSKEQKKDASSKNGNEESAEFVNQQPTSAAGEDGDEKLPPLLRKQKTKLLQLRDTLLDSMMGVSRDTLRSRAEGSEASAFGMHQADAGSDAYDRDFALSLLSRDRTRSTRSKRRSSASMPAPMGYVKCPASRFRMPAWKRSHSQDLLSNARPKLKNKRRRHVFGNPSPRCLV